ncbi:MAG: hypothetical protein EF811_02795 [Methanonatronarchaeia archaeon]|nr:MAG: hypothetical protein EF811_02795 [Methanonatronarchaeia archaeon]
MTEELEYDGEIIKLKKVKSNRWDDDVIEGEPCFEIEVKDSEFVNFHKLTIPKEELDGDLRLEDKVKISIEVE